MPVHDWTRVSDGTFHDFHGAWIFEIRNALNGGILPPDYYAQAEQYAGDVIPDVLTLRTTGSNGEQAPAEPQGMTAVAEAPPRVHYTATMEGDVYALKQRTLVIRHSSGDRVIALVEIVSAANKRNTGNFRALLDKAIHALLQGYHLLIVDLQPPTLRDPQGIHGAIWTEIGDDSYVAPASKRLTLAAYCAGVPKTAYVEPVAAGDRLPDMPLFLTPRHYVSVPLEATYLAGYRGVPERWRRVLEAP